jgi:hypothetical protein
MSKARKNDIIVVEESKSFTGVKMKTVRYDTYFIAKVVKATRDGIVERFQKIGGSVMDTDGAKTLRVLTVEDPDKQALARKLADLLAVEPAKNYYKDHRQVRDAILTTTP